MSKEKQRQIIRILSIYERLLNGQTIIKKDESSRYVVSEKSIQRDIDHIRDYVELAKFGHYIEFNRALNGYVYESEEDTWLTNEEVFALVKVLLESRAFPKKEMVAIIDKLLQLAHKEQRPLIEQMIKNETYLYVELEHKKNLLPSLWQLAVAIQSKKVVELEYVRTGDKDVVKRLVKPLGIVFSEYYFYLMAQPYEKDYEYPTIYRIDRIDALTVTAIPFDVPYRDRFQEGEFKKRVQFMYTGELLRIRFAYTGKSPQAVVDRLPTATIVEQTEGRIVFEAEVFGTGIKMWLLSQGAMIEVLAPATFRMEMQQTLEQMLTMYQAPVQS